MIPTSSSCSEQDFPSVFQDVSTLPMFLRVYTLVKICCRLLQLSRILSLFLSIIFVFVYYLCFCLLSLFFSVIFVFVYYLCFCLLSLFLSVIFVFVYYLCFCLLSLFLSIIFVFVYYLCFCLLSLFLSIIFVFVYYLCLSSQACVPLMTAWSVPST